MHCLDCGEDRFTIRGLCLLCAPALHAEAHERLERYAVARRAFMIETELNPLSDYDAFDRWLAVHPEFV
jgi:hypothetical protein